MVKSRLNKDILYVEERGVRDEDNKYETSLYQALLDNVSVTIAIGRPKQDFSDLGVIFFPIYLINKKTMIRIGVYEVLESDMEQAKEGEPDIRLLGEPLMFSFVNKKFALSNQIAKLGNDDNDPDVYIIESVPADGWCSMHAVDQFLKSVGVFNKIPGHNQVPTTLMDMATAKGNEYGHTEKTKTWLQQFTSDQTLWDPDTSNISPSSLPSVTNSDADLAFLKGNHSTPDTACGYIENKTNGKFECLRNVFEFGLDTLPEKLQNNTRFTKDEIKQIINENNLIMTLREDTQYTTQEETDNSVENNELVIFVNTGNHWEIIYSPKIPKVKNEPPKQDNDGKTNNSVVSKGTRKKGKVTKGKKKKKINESCEEDTDCANDNCIDSKCTRKKGKVTKGKKKKKINEPCEEDTDCANDNCIDSKCTRKKTGKI